MLLMRVRKGKDEYHFVKCSKQRSWKKNGCERKASSILYPKMTPGSILNTVHNFSCRKILSIGSVSY